MFIIALSDMQTMLFIVLVLVWAALLLGGFIFGKYDSQNQRRMPLWTRLASSMVLVICAWLWFTVSQSSQVNTLALCFAIGMTLGFIGDLFMAKIFPLEQYVLGGIAAFGLGHIVYIIGMVSAGSLLNTPFPNWVALLFWWVVALVGWFVVVFYRSKPATLHYAALLYSVLLASTAGFATSLWLADGTFVLTAIGAALFLLSDLILAAGLFERVRLPLHDDIVWLTYGPGQMLIVAGLILQSVLFRR